jgi:hypothetical protein
MLLDANGRVLANHPLPSPAALRDHSAGPHSKCMMVAAMRAI